MQEEANEGVVTPEAAERGCYGPLLELHRRSGTTCCVWCILETRTPTKKRYCPELR